MLIIKQHNILSVRRRRRRRLPRFLDLGPNLLKGRLNYQFDLHPVWVDSIIIKTRVRTWWSDGGKKK